MSIFIVRPRLTGQAKAEGKEGAQAIVVREATEGKAKEVGAKQLGLPLHQVEVVVSSGGGGAVVGALPGATVDPEELREVMGQGSEVIPGTWESINE